MLQNEGNLYTSRVQWYYMLKKKTSINHIMVLKVDNQITEVEENIGHFFMVYVHFRHQNSIITCQYPKCFDVHILSLAKLNVQLSFEYTLCS